MELARGVSDAKCTARGRGAVVAAGGCGGVGLADAGGADGAGPLVAARSGVTIRVRHTSEAALPAALRADSIAEWTNS